MVFKKQVVLALAATCLVFLALHQQCNARPEGEKLEDKFDCKKVMGRIMKKMMKLFNNCTKEVKAESTKEDFEKKMSCIVKCVMGKIGLMDNSSMVSTATVQNFMTTMDIPEEAHDLGHFLAEDCVNEHASKLDPAQPFCESYGDFTMCMQTVFGNFAEKANCQPNLPG
ncbi:uncharacterized protein LOC110860964 [Folsomia candida]|uniref:uncharacterized protein LOC110860964 n=1 Tax=Folsomia candida TaxID=158441 RepID=UPI000B8FADB1|nr:uncharacterized protein LOC110860964 [Folsomia candida]